MCLTLHSQPGIPIPKESPNQLTCTVDKMGFLTFNLAFSMRVDVSTHSGIRIFNPLQGSTLSLSGCATQMAMVHPKGRLLQYMNRIEVQARDEKSCKFAKIYPKGVSFSGSNCALVYLVDSAGVRSTTDAFHDLYGQNVADCES